MIIYTDPDTGNVCSCTLMSSVPEGVTGYEATNPPADKDMRDAWVINAGQLSFDLDKAKVIKTKEARKEAADMMKTITDNYDDAEIATWDIQEAEARGNAPDSYLIELASASEITLADLKTSIIAKADAYRSLSAQSVGRRKKKVAAFAAIGSAGQIVAADSTEITDLKAVTF